MVIVAPAPAALSPANLSLFYTTDELLSNSPVLIFYGHTATASQATQSRIQAHVFTPAGLQTFARLVIAPTGAFYAAVDCLPREEQGDDVCRGLAFSLYKYFVELPDNVKDAWEKNHCSLGKLPSAPPLFSDAHAAMLAARMVRVENTAEIITDVQRALSEQTLSWVDLDVVLPRGAIQKPDGLRESSLFDESEDSILLQRYGQYADVVKLFGESSFLPTARLRRAPSRPTALNPTQTFSAKQKENLRKELIELLDTEERYVEKIYDLSHNIATNFRLKAKQKSFSSSSPTEQALKALFPPSLDQILEVNAAFLEVIRNIVEETENDAIQDIQATADDIYVAPLRGQKDTPDVTGAVAVAKALVEWFPKFAEGYTDYIAAHSSFPQLLKGFTKDSGSSFSKRVQETGEQRLSSLLIEPVQRLPRYNLYIDNIVKQLPLRHPAIKPFLKARDIISEICSHDTSSSQTAKAVGRLRKMVFSWPPGFNPQGRLIAVVDCSELAPPYLVDPNDRASSSGIFLLFADFLVLLHKPQGCSITARGLLADLDNPKFAETFSGSPELIFHQQIKLCDVILSEHNSGQCLQLISPVPNVNSAGRPRSRDRQHIGIRTFHLAGMYEGKVQKFVEEVVKARVEGRFSEAEREGGKWEVRRVSGDLNLFSSVAEDTQGEPVPGRREPARIQVLIDHEKFPKPGVVDEQGIEMVVHVALLEHGFLLVEVSGINGYSSRDKVTSAEFLPVLNKRLGNFLQARNCIKNVRLSEAFLSRNQQILKSLPVQVEGGEADGEGKSRPHSPVKVLSNLFGGSLKESSNARKLHRPPAPIGNIPRMMPPLAPVSSRGHSRDGELSRPTSSSKSASFNASTMVPDHVVKLEEALNTLLMALGARKGNIVGRAVRARAVADELVVNELYNALLENPTNPEPPSQSSVDVLFATFEKFLKVVWRDQMGPVLSHATLVSLQMRSDIMPPAEFEEFFRATFSQMSPHNQHYLTEIIKLLADLLEGTSNDGDKGILTVAFAEILVCEGNPSDFISLIDRFIQDFEPLFTVPPSGLSTPSYGSVDSKTRAAAAGSLTSNTSLRKRFGLGTLTRENSKSEHESKVGSLWRSLSKNNHGSDSQPSSVSKSAHAYLARSNSVDAGIIASPKRPTSRERPTLLGAFSFESHESPRYGGGGLTTIGERGEVPGGPPRKKRRSSLPDNLHAAQTADHTPTWSPKTPRPQGSRLPKRQTSTSPRTPMPAKPSQLPAPSRLGSPFRTEPNSTSVLERINSIQPKTPLKSDEVTIKSYSPSKRRTDSISSGIPTLKPTVTNTSNTGLSERPTSGNTLKLPPSTPRAQVLKPPAPVSASTTTPRRLKLQSPQKLRERLQSQQKDIESAGKRLQDELSAIGHELSSKRPRSLTASNPSSSIPSSSTGSILRSNAESRISALEKTLKSTLDALAARTEAVAADVASSLHVSEARAKKLDQLYREANAENEALYARFNEELSKMARSVKGGVQNGGSGGGEEFLRKLNEQDEELVRLRKENMRLKREVVGLKAQLRE